MNHPLFRERFRPQYHFTAPKGWLNDPNGLIFYRGEYHLFYQYNPHDISWGAPHWGHAVSDDMIHWKDLPIALYPDDLGSIFSGTVVADDRNTSGLFNNAGGLVAIFTHDLHGREYQSIAFSNDNGRTWSKYTDNPVLIGGNGPEWKDFRDPKVFRFNNQWIMLLGGGRYRFYASDDLIHWSFLNDMAVFEEFPDVFLLDNQWILNINGYGYYVGSFTKAGFIPCQPMQFAESANSWQACYTFSDLPSDRRVWMAWMRDSAKGPTDPWRCNMSIPRELTLIKENDQYQILQYPIHELKTLRDLQFSCADVPIEDMEYTAIHGQCLDIEMTIQLNGKAPLQIHCFEKDDEYLEIGYRSSEHLFYVDTRNATSPDLRQYCTMFPSYMSINGNQIKVLSKLFTKYYCAESNISIRILLDVSTAEVFVDGGRLSFTMNVYPGIEADGFSIYGSSHRIQNLSAYQMRPIRP